MIGSERAHLGETPASLGRDYLADVVGRRCFFASADREAIVGVMEDEFTSVMAERVAEGTAVISGVRPATIRPAGQRAGRFSSGFVCPPGRDLLALGEAYWYTEDPVFVRLFCEILDRWSAEPMTKGAERISPWVRTAQILGWTLGTQCILSSSFLLEKDAARLLRGLEREGRYLSGWLSSHRKPARERAAALAGIGILGTLYPEAFDRYDWFEQGLGELALSAEAYLDPERKVITPCEAMQIYVPLVALSWRNDLAVPGAVLAGLDASSRELAREPSRGDTAGPALLPMLSDREETIASLQLAAAFLLGRIEPERRLEEAGSGLLFLLGKDAFAEDEGLFEVPRRAAGVRAYDRPFLDSPEPAA